MYVNNVIRPLKLWCFILLNASASITFARTPGAGRGHFSLTCQQSAIWPIRSWYQRTGGIKTTSTGSPAFFFSLRPRTAFFARRSCFSPRCTWEPVHRLSNIRHTLGISVVKSYNINHMWSNFMEIVSLILGEVKRKPILCILWNTVLVFKSASVLFVELWRIAQSECPWNLAVTYFTCSTSCP